MNKTNAEFMIKQLKKIHDMVANAHSISDIIELSVLQGCQISITQETKERKQSFDHPFIAEIAKITDSLLKLDREIQDIISEYEYKDENGNYTLFFPELLDQQKTFKEIYNDGITDEEFMEK